MPDVTYREAISAALREEMDLDPDVYLIGEDIGLGGGAFGVTKGFLECYGPMRVVDAPLSESGFVGLAIGSAQMGLRPVVEMQFADFITETFKMLVNYAGGANYRQVGPVPLVVRLPAGALKCAGPFHSCNPEAWFYHTPGLKVVAPATPYDAKGLLKAAVRDDNPVLYLEYKKLYNLPPNQYPASLRMEVPEEAYTVPMGKARLVREGKDVTLITHGTMVLDSVRAAEEVERDGIDVEVVDLRSILPFDRETFIGSVKKTGRAVIVHEDHKTGGVGAEWSALLVEEAFESLDAPVRRVAALDTPVPYSPPLEENFLPNAEKIAEALREVTAF
ncbi:MAG: alpha-ketoacid dehydrogenase subunit beta [Nitrospinota bacterium]